MKFAGKWKELENNILSEVTQTQKDKHGLTVTFVQISCDLSCRPRNSRGGRGGTPEKPMGGSLLDHPTNYKACRTGQVAPNDVGLEARTLTGRREIGSSRTFHDEPINTERPLAPPLLPHDQDELSALTKVHKKIYPVIYKNKPEEEWLDPSSEAELEEEAARNEKVKNNSGPLKDGGPGVMQRPLPPPYGPSDVVATASPSRRSGKAINLALPRIQNLLETKQSLLEQVSNLKDVLSLKKELRDLTLQIQELQAVNKSPGPSREGSHAAPLTAAAVCDSKGLKPTDTPTEGLLSRLHMEFTMRRSFPLGTLGLKFCLLMSVFLMFG
ncbi:hypothetical protein STEG23_033669 [Scotinomys teguina]